MGEPGHRLLRTHLRRFLESHEPGLSPEQWFLLERSSDRADRRSWLLSLTARGRERTDALIEAVVAERELVFAGFADEELTAIAKALDRVDSNVRRLLSLRPTA